MSAAAPTGSPNERRATTASKSFSHDENVKQHDDFHGALLAQLSQVSHPFPNTSLHCLLLEPWAKEAKFA